jgi:hypothetical protein
VRSRPRVRELLFPVSSVCQRSHLLPCNPPLVTKPFTFHFSPFTGCFLTSNLLFGVPAVFIVSMLPTILRLLAWFIVFLGATFCWIVLIEHGPDDFVEGCKIEAANFRAIVTRVVTPRAQGTP